MSSFPPKKWEVRYLRDMQTLDCVSLDQGISMSAYMALKPAGGEEGSFRFVLAGPNKLKIRFEVSDVLNNPLFGGMFAEAELAIGDQIRIEKNSAGSAWVDVVELIRSQDYLVTDSDDNDVADEFLANLEKCKKELDKKDHGQILGISIRWILGTLPDSTRVLLFAQVMRIVMYNNYKTLFFTKIREGNTFTSDTYTKKFLLGAALRARPHRR